MGTVRSTPSVDNECEPRHRPARHAAIDHAADLTRELTEARREAVHYERENRRLVSVLRDSEERFLRSFELGLIGMAITSPSKGCLDVNDHLCRMLGYEREELLRANWAEMTHPDDLAADVAHFERVMRDELDGYSLDKRWIRKDGQIVHSTISVRCMRREDRSVDYFVALVKHTSERNRGEEGLRSSEASRNADLAAMMRLQEVSTRMAEAGDSASLLQEIVNAAIAITCADMGCIQLVDRDSDAMRMVASSGFERPFLDFFASVDHDGGACGVAKGNGNRVVVKDIAASPMFADEQAQQVMIDAGVRAAQSTPLVNRSGLVVGMLSTHYRQPRQPREPDLRLLDMLARQAADWIERMHAEQALQAAEEERQALLASEREARAAAEQAARLKDEFLATISHELRTPIFNLLLLVDLMRDGLDPATLAEELTTVERMAKTQARLIDDLLDLSRISAGKLSLEEELVELETAIQLAINVVMPRAQEQGVEVRLCFMARPSTLRGDITRLQQVFWNLLANAVKFTPAGGLVEIRLERSGPDLVVTVRDTGQGIDPEFLPHVFDRFRQADGSASRSHAGLGLGLTIVKHLVELHGGSARAESAGIGHGATFIVSLPAERDVALPANGSGAPRLARGPSLAGVRILFVDDDPVTRRLIARVLAESEALIATASSVDEALERLSTTTPDVLISDIGMPGKDGYSLIREIRRTQRHVHLPAIALTAFARPVDGARCLAAGFDRHVAKPVDPCELRATVDGLLRERSIVRRASAPT